MNETKHAPVYDQVAPTVAPTTSPKMQLFTGEQYDPNARVAELEKRVKELEAHATASRMLLDEAKNIAREYLKNDSDSFVALVRALCERVDEAESASFKLPQNGTDLDMVERDLLKQALERTAGNQSAAARLLGISRYTLRYRCEKHKLF